MLTGSTMSESCSLPSGPIAQCIPIRRERLDLRFGTFDTADTDRYQHTAATLLAGPGHDRKIFRASRDAGDESVPQSGRTEE